MVLAPFTMVSELAGTTRQLCPIAEVHDFEALTTAWTRSSRSGVSWCPEGGTGGARRSEWWVATWGREFPAFMVQARHPVTSANLALMTVFEWRQLVLSAAAVLRIAHPFSFLVSSGFVRPCGVWLDDVVVPSGDGVPCAFITANACCERYGFTFGSRHSGMTRKA